MTLHEEAVDTCRDRRSREDLNEVARSTGATRSTTHTLNAMGRVKYDGISGLSHNNEVARIHDEVAIAEAGASLAQKDLVVACARYLFGDELHIGGVKELSLLNVNRFTGRTGRYEEICLSAEKRWYLKDIDYLSHLAGLLL